MESVSTDASTVTIDNMSSVFDVKKVEKSEIIKMIQNNSSHMVDRRSVENDIKFKLDNVEKLKLSDITNKDKVQCGRAVVKHLKNIFKVFPGNFLEILVVNDFDIGSYRASLDLELAKSSEMFKDAEKWSKKKITDIDKDYYESKKSNELVDMKKLFKEQLIHVTDVCNIIYTLKVGTDDYDALRGCIEGLSQVEGIIELCEDFIRYEFDHQEEKITTLNLRPKKELLAALKRYIETNKEQSLQEIEYKFNQQYIKDYENYKSEVQKKNNSEELSTVLKNKIDRLIIEIAYLDSIKNIQDRIIAIIMADIEIIDEKHTTFNFKNYFRTQAIEITESGRKVSIDQICHDLPAITQIMLTEFHKSTFVSFTELFVRTLTWKLNAETFNDNVMSAIKQIEELMDEWESRDAWKLMESKDYFWTYRLLTGLPPGNITDELYKDINEYIREQEKKGFPDSKSEGSKKPVYEFAKERLKILETLKLTKKAAGNDKPRYNNNNYNNRSSNGFKGKGVEEARIAENSEKFNYIVKDADEFVEDILKSKGYGVKTDRGQLIPYVAVTKLRDTCQTCNKDHDFKKWCKPTCITAMCKKCGKYGHLKQFCHSRREQISNNGQNKNGSESKVSESA